MQPEAVQIFQFYFVTGIDECESLELLQAMFKALNSIPIYFNWFRLIDLCRALVYNYQKKLCFATGAYSTKFRMSFSV
jgi:hypothetical protein